MCKRFTCEKRDSENQPVVCKSQHDADKMYNTSLLNVYNAGDRLMGTFHLFLDAVVCKCVKIHMR